MYTVPGNTQYYTVKLFQIKNEIHVPLPCVVLLLPVIFCTNTNSADVKINTHCACTHKKVFSFTYVYVYIFVHTYNGFTLARTLVHTSLFAYFKVHLL
jgi:hypothetical protein